MICGEEHVLNILFNEQNGSQLNCPLKIEINKILSISDIVLK